MGHSPRHHYSCSVRVATRSPWVPRVAATLVIVLSLSLFTRAEAALPPDAAKRIDAVFADFASPQSPGCAVAVFQQGAITFAKGYGAANLEYGIPITPDTRFTVGSVSKQFTAAAIALLVQEGRLRTTDDIRTYVPELRDFGKTITIDHLVHHTSGLRDFWTLVQIADMRNDDGYTVDDVIRIASRQHHLNFDPGTEYNYSNTGYVLLGVVVQRITGQTLRQFADEHLFGPLGMRESYYVDDHSELVRGRAAAYSPEPGGGWRTNIWHNDLVGQGGVVTTVRELQKWDENFYSGRVGGSKLLELQRTRGVLNDSTIISYAFGLDMLEYRGLPIVEHAGSSGGYRANLVRFPTKHTSVAATCNTSSAEPVQLTHRVADIVLESAFAKPVPAVVAPAEPRRQVEPTAAALERFTGRYHSDELDATFDITPSADGLRLRRPRTGSLPLNVSDQQTLRTPLLTLRFAGPASGPWTSFIIEAGRVRGIEFVRIAEPSK